MPRTDCPLCGHGELAAMLDRADVPTLQNRHYASAAAARAAARGTLAIRICRRCGFGFNAAFVPELAAYGPDYENDQAGSAVFARHLAERARLVAARVGDGGTVVEIGCGQGGFLRAVVGAAGGRVARALGFDPAWRGGDAEPPMAMRATVLAAGDKAAIGRVDAIATRHVIEHVPEPLAFLATLAAAADADRTAMLVETPCLQWILDHGAIHDVFYEHCNYFTADTLGGALVQAGFVVTGIEHVFGGQYLWAQARLRRAGDPADAGQPSPGATVAGAGAFAARFAAAVAHGRRAIGTARDVALWGAGAKGSTLAAALDPDAAAIDCLIDINPRKQGGFVAGSGHRIAAPEEAAARGVRRVAIMNPNYRSEIMEDIRRRNLPFRTVELELPA